MDRINGWGKVNHDDAGDTYTISAHLQIGRNNGAHTYFQI